MARPYTFDPEAALAAAMQVFWRDGYDLASLSSLQSEMGIQRGSLYQEYGSKKELYLKALNHYVELFVDPGINLLTRAEGSGSERVKRFFGLVPIGETRGCLLCNSAAGVAGSDKDIRQAISAQLERLREAFEGALADEIADRVERRQQAEQYTQLYIGKRVEARTATRTG